MKNVTKTCNPADSLQSLSTKNQYSPPGRYM